MIDSNGKHIIKLLQKKWQLLSLLSFVLISISVSIIFIALVQKLLPKAILGTVIFLIITAILIILKTKYWRIKQADVVRYLNRNFLALEDSSALILMQPEKLTLLQQLQAKKTSSILESINIKNPIKKRITKSLIGFVISALIAITITSLNFNNTYSLKQNSISSIYKKEIILPQIKGITVKIIPPYYTNKIAKNQLQFNLKIEEGAIVNWLLQTNVSAKRIEFIFNDSSIVSLKPTNENHTSWIFQKPIVKSGFYQVKVDELLSELYQIEVIKDLPPIITIQSPKPNTVIDYGQPTKVKLALNISDDYGIKDAYINATIASGNGEGVKFKELTIRFNTSLDQEQQNVQLNQIIDLNKLQMQPGDELYFYVKAIDNFKQETRSDIFIVTLPDTTQLMSLEGLANNINFKPEFFRSERQIIIDAEQLIKDKDSISVETFRERSNNLGIDQKLLRLRYGKFLGEENESDIGLESAEALDATEFGDGSKMIDAVTDKHDNAEDASFLDADTKRRLKAVLNEMWSTELRLRTYKPQEALPFAYKALRLLKELQQQSRAYVAKTSFKTTPLKPEKRLTADLSKIIPPLTQQQLIIAASKELILQDAISILEGAKNKQPLAQNTIPILSKAALQLSAVAALQPSSYLQAFETLKKVISNVQKQGNIPISTDVKIIQNALQKLLVQPVALPKKTKQVNDMNLSQQYFINLHKMQQ